LISSAFLYVQAGEPARFDAASVKQASGWGPMAEPKGRIDYGGASLFHVIRRAYGVEEMQVRGPSWLSTEFYEIRASMPPEAPLHRLQLMLQSHGAERFGIQVHREKKKFATYRMVQAKGGSKLKPTDGVLSYGMPRDAAGRHIRGRISMPILASVLSSVLER